MQVQDTNIINGLAAIILLATFIIVASNRLSSVVRTFAIQSLALGLLAAVVAYFTRAEHIYIVALLTIALKAIAIPRILIYVMDRIKVEREVEPLIGIPSSLLICGILTIVAYYLSEPFAADGNITTITSNCLAISLAVVLIGFFTMISRKKAVSQVIGLLVMENGLFLAAISLTYGMPMIVELGVFFDVLVAVIIMGVFAFRINQTFATIDTTFLRRLKD